MAGPLGCAQEYRAAFHWRGGGQLYGPVLVNELVEVVWGRTADDISEAKIRIAPQSMSAQCLQAVVGKVTPSGELTGGLEPWIHELTLYRDNDLVWQGPVLRSVMSPRRGIVVEALDVYAWLDRVINTWRMAFTSKGPDAARRPGPVTKIARTILELNLRESSLSQPPDWAGILDYVVEKRTEETVRFERDGSSNKAIWGESVGNILRELTKRGLLFTTVGRSIVLRGRPDNKTPARGRLILSDFIGDVEMIRDGTTAATASWATSQDQQDITKGRVEIVGKWGTEYGRLDVLTRVTDGSASDLRQAAAKALEGRYPAPIAVSVPEGAQLSPSAPVGIKDLVCGERLDVVSPEYRIGQGFAVSDVDVAWSGDAGEKVGVSLVPLSDPYGVPVDPPDEPVVAGVG